MLKVLGRACSYLYARSPTRNALLSHTMTECTTVPTLVDQKKTLRKTVKNDLKKLTQEQMHNESTSSGYHGPVVPLTVGRDGVIGGTIDLISILAGCLIADRILHAEFFQRSKRVGVYIHCAPLREVDTSQLVTAVTTAGALCLPDPKPCMLCPPEGSLRPAH